MSLAAGSISRPADGELRTSGLPAAALPLHDIGHHSLSSEGISYMTTETVIEVGPFIAVGAVGLLLAAGKES